MALVWKCKCGEFQIKLKKEPIKCVNCHCHSCIAAARHIDEKRNGQGKNGTSSIDETTLGCAIAWVELKDTEFVDENPSDKLDYCKVGEEGKVVRSYTKCCGSQVHCGCGKSHPVTFHMYNRNGIYNVNEDGDGVTKYEPKGYTPPNIMSKFAFTNDDPSIIIPKPKYQYAPLSFPFYMLPSAIKAKFGMGLGSLSDDAMKAIYKDHEEVTEIVPITWK